MNLESVNDKIKAIKYIMDNDLIVPQMLEEARADLKKYVGMKNELLNAMKTNPEPNFPEEAEEPNYEEEFRFTGNVSVAPVHPLINPASRHYEMIDNVEAILRMEQMYSTQELMSWANISAMKYRLRIGHKDDVTKEASKIAGFEAYYKYLEQRL